MAIDTVNKRVSVVGAGRPYLRSTWPATIDEFWRLSVGNAYSGNSLISGQGKKGPLGMPLWGPLAGPI